MKKITLIVPDSITSCFGGMTVMESSTDVTPEIVLNLICKRPDYHEEYYFKDPDAVKIIIEEYKKENQPA